MSDQDLKPSTTADQVIAEKVDALVDRLIEVGDARATPIQRGESYLIVFTLASDATRADYERASALARSINEKLTALGTPAVSVVVSETINVNVYDLKKKGG